ncbi:MAG: glycoside hydrolase family 3 C-terminal domain-containing protein [Clostridiales Family XIII bacterium]|jgi:beta-glucosidase|nr:glycoside hydrolase family 3 C-terminal domain-containing protein [Clostridiales Family XIII bacterium]
MKGRRKAVAVFTALAVSVGTVPWTPMTALADGADTGTPATPIYKNTDYSFEERAADLVAQMTLAEKASQTTGSVAPAIPRLDVEGYNWWSEAIHGYSRSTSTTGGATSYPVSYAAGSTWDPELYYREAQQIGAEIRESARNNKLNLTVYSPTVNLARDARWGRNDESYGEDPYLTGVMGAEFVKGVEGKDKNGTLLKSNDAGEGYYQVMTTIKHYTANNSEQNRQYGGANNIDLRALREYYTRPYRDIIRSADVQSVMTAYSTVDGVPASYSSYLMDTLLRQTWGFSGYITSDCDSVSSSAGRQRYKTNPQTGRTYTVPEAFATAMAHGEDLECNAGITDNNGTYATRMAEMLSGGAIRTDKGVFTENQLDVTVQRLMAARMKLGEFDGATAYQSEGASRLAAGRAGGFVNNITGQTQARLDLAEEVSENSVVLLKNQPTDGGVSPILPVTQAKVSAALQEKPEGSKYNIVVVGPVAKSTYLGGYSPAFAANEKANFKTIYDGISDAFGSYDDVNVEYAEFFDYSDTAVVINNYFGPQYTNVAEQVANNNFTYIKIDGEDTDVPKSTPNAVTLSKIAAADLVVVVAGQGSGDSNEDQDRTDLLLRKAQTTLIDEAATRNPNTVLVMETYGPVEVKDFENKVPAIMWASFGGVRKVGFGRAIAGQISPSGRTTALWHYDTKNDIPSPRDYNLYPDAERKTDGRTYMYYTKPVSYPFGYGLSYTDTTFDSISLSDAAPTANDVMTVSLDVVNKNAVSGREVVQIYAVSPNAGDNDIPNKRLVGFKKVDVPASGETSVNIAVKVADLAFFDPAAGIYKVPEGTWTIYASKSSDLAEPSAVSATFVIESGAGAIEAKPAVVTVTANQMGDETGTGTGSLSVNVAERLIFDKGRQIIPHVAVAMTDEKIYGRTIVDNIPGQDIGSWGIDETQSQGGGTVNPPIADLKTPKLADISLPGGMSVVYSVKDPAKNRNVVSISGTEGGQIITAVSPGVETLVAKVTDASGNTAETEFVVYVTSNPAPGGITVGGKPLANFDPDVFAYEIEGAVASVAAVRPTPNDVSYSYTVVQATAANPVATIVATDASSANGKTLIYKIGFGASPTSINFKNKELAEPWIVMGPDSSGMTQDASGLKLTTLQGSSLASAPKNLCLQPAFGDWTAETFISSFSAIVANGQQVGLVIYDKDSGNYLRFGYDQQTISFFGMEWVTMNYGVIKGEGGAESNLGGFSYSAFGGGTPDNMTPPAQLWLRAVKIGSQYTFAFSKDHASWFSAEPIDVHFALPHIGVAAENGVGIYDFWGGFTPAPTTPVTATFDYMSIYNDATLGELSVTPGAINPAFLPTVTKYTVSLPNTVRSLTVTASANSGGATVTGAGVKALNVGDNKFEVIVTAEDGITTRKYEIVANRKSSGLGVETSGGGSAAPQPNVTQPAVTVTPGAVVPLDPNPAEGPLSKFTDASGISAWALPFFEKLVQAGVISGDSDGTLKPKRNVTRAEFTKMIVVAAKIPSGGTAKLFPSDVNAGDWYKEFVDIASAYDIVKGVSETAFAPNINITRQDLAAIAYRALVFSKVSLPAPDGDKFSDDVRIADYAKDAVYTLKKLQIVSGRDSGGFDPTAFATREEAVKIVSGVMDCMASGTVATAQADAQETAAPAGSSK